MAEREGFEPSDQLPSRILSKDVHSATLPSLHNHFSLLAEGEGFEPPVSRPTTVFKTAAFNHSAIPPIIPERNVEGAFIAPIPQDATLFFLISAKNYGGDFG